MSASPALPLIVFDGDCGFCTRSIEWGRRWIRRLPTAVPYQRTDLASLGLDEVACRTAVQFVDAEGRIAAGERAVSALLRSAGLPWSPLGWIIGLPGVRSLAGIIYRWIARNRHRLPGASDACAIGPSDPD
ncbi:MAG: thiol-disulfide oxidoreductase DCC family protein [Ilumatobacteraceae bacterium]